MLLFNINKKEGYESAIAPILLQSCPNVHKYVCRKISNQIFKSHLTDILMFFSLVFFKLQRYSVFDTFLAFEILISLFLHFGTLFRVRNKLRVRDWET